MLIFCSLLSVGIHNAVVDGRRYAFQVEPSKNYKHSAYAHARAYTKPHRCQTKMKLEQFHQSLRQQASVSRYHLWLQRW